MQIIANNTARADDFPAVETYECREDIVAGDTVAISQLNDTNTTAPNFTVDNTNSQYTDTTWKAQSLVTEADTTLIRSLTIRLNTGGNHQAKVSIRSSLTGSDLWDSQFAVTSGTVNYSFNVNLTVTGSTTYYIIVRNGNSISSGQVRVDNTDTYGTVHASTDSGSSWSTESGYRWYVVMVQSSGLAGKLIKASASAFNSRLGFIGFALETKNAGQDCMVNVWMIETKTGLTAGADYYLSNTNGAISTTPGTIERWVGRAKSTTKLDRQIGRRRVVGTISNIPFAALCPANGYIHKNHLSNNDATINIDGVDFQGRGGVGVPIEKGQEYTINDGGSSRFILMQ